MIPFKDSLPTDRFPAATLLLIVASAVALIVHGSPFVLAVSVPLLWLFGPPVEDASSPARVAALYGLGALAGAALAGDFDVTVAACGGAAALVAARLVVHPRARTVCLWLVPLFSTIVELPAAVFALAGGVLLVVAGDALAVLAGAVLGAALVKLVVRPERLKRDPPRDHGYRVPVLGR